MTPEEIRVIIEAAVKKTAGMSYLQFTLLAAITSAASFFGAYFQEQGYFILNSFFNNFSP